MEQLFEILGPLVIVLIWVISAVASALQNKDKEKGSRPDETGGQDPSAGEQALERARRIREEVRQRMERARREFQGESPAEERSASAGSGLQTSQRESWEPSWSQPAGSGNRGRESRPPGAARSAMEDELDRQLAEMRRSAERRDQEMRKAGLGAAVGADQIGTGGADLVGSDTAADAYAIYGPGERYNPVLREVRQAMNDPQSARKAFIYRQIFGPPAGLRRNTVFRPNIDED